VTSKIVPLVKGHEALEDWREVTLTLLDQAVLQEEGDHEVAVEVVLEMALHEKGLEAVDEVTPKMALQELRQGDDRKVVDGMIQEVVLHEILQEIEHEAVAEPTLEIALHTILQQQEHEVLGQVIHVVLHEVPQEGGHEAVNGAKRHIARKEMNEIVQEHGAAGEATQEISRC